LTIPDASFGQWLKAISRKLLIRGLDLNARERWRTLMNDGLNPTRSASLLSSFQSNNQTLKGR
jgi:hypothetical protein